MRKPKILIEIGNKIKTEVTEQHLFLENIANLSFFPPKALLATAGMSNLSKVGHRLNDKIVVLTNISENLLLIVQITSEEQKKIIVLNSFSNLLKFCCFSSKF